VARERLTFRQRDLAAALKAAKAAGYPVARIEVRKDGIVLIPGIPGSKAQDDPDTDPETLAIEQAIRNAKQNL
jgi:hypothetical protein